jgi:hypothetical protein
MVRDASELMIDAAPRLLAKKDGIDKVDYHIGNQNVGDPGHFVIDRMHIPAIRRVHLDQQAMGHKQHNQQQEGSHASLLCDVASASFLHPYPAACPRSGLFGTEVVGFGMVED